MSSFYGGVSALAFDPQYVASFYMPVFTVDENDVLIIKNYTKEKPSRLVNNDGVLDIITDKV